MEVELCFSLFKIILWVFNKLFNLKIYKQKYMLSSRTIISFAHSDFSVSHSHSRNYYYIPPECVYKKSLLFNMIACTLTASARLSRTTQEPVNWCHVAFISQIGLMPEFHSSSLSTHCWCIHHAEITLNLVVLLFSLSLYDWLYHLTLKQLLYQYYIYFTSSN